MASVLVAGLLGAGAGQAAAESPDATGSSAAERSEPSDELLDLQHRVVDDRDRAKRGHLRLGGLSDGVFRVEIDRQREQVVITMPILRAPLLERTRMLVARRYGDAPVYVRLSQLARLRPVTGDGIPSRPGRALQCPARHLRQPVPPQQGLNAKRIQGLHVEVAAALARRHGCTVREVVIDGMNQGVTSDLRYNRINVVTRRNRVTHVPGIY